jgi:hypothetical protein
MTCALHADWQIVYKTGRLRVAIITANMVRYDWDFIENVCAACPRAGVELMSRLHSCKTFYPSPTRPLLYQSSVTPSTTLRYSFAASSSTSRYTKPYGSCATIIQGADR